MAEDESVRPRGLGGRKERAQAVQFFRSDREANHLFDCGLQLGVNGEKGIKLRLLITSIELMGQATLPGSFLTTSAVLKIPWIEQALTLNW